MGSASAVVVLIGFGWLVGLMVSLARPRGVRPVAAHAPRRNSGVTTRSSRGGSWGPSRATRTARPGRSRSDVFAAGSHGRSREMLGRTDAVLTKSRGAEEFGWTFR